MTLTENVLKYLNQPFPLWECELTASLVSHKWAQLGLDRRINATHYSTVGWLHQGERQMGVVQNKRALALPGGEDVIYVEPPSFEKLKAFYDEHGLLPVTEPDLIANQAGSKIGKAFDVIGKVPLAQACVQKLVRSIQVVQQPEAEIDVSYSHPAIPFSIFVSVCPDDSSTSNLRVAESILHESMHLKLTLIEDVRPLIKQQASGLYFSPWREERRPAQGVLHGLFVFRAILDFYDGLLLGSSTARERAYLADRTDQIKEEIGQLKSFLLCEDLTKDGATLTGNLLPSS